ncbi:MAG: ABC transporter substrate-binding protein [Thermomicrobiales bacterium]
MKHGRLPIVRVVPALLLAVALLAPPAALARQGTPAASPAATGEATTSLTREEFKTQVEEAFPIEEPQSTDGTFVQGGVGDLQSLNPFLAEEETSINITGLIFEGLVGGDPRTGQPAPGGLADWWEVAADGVTYTFHLNQDATWHDGADVTAEDVQFSFDALADPATASAYTGSFTAGVASWRVIDDDTFEVTSNGISASFLYDLFGVSVVPKHIWESVPHENWAADPGSTGQDPSRIVGTGPLKFEEWVQGQEVRLGRNDDYYQRVPAIAEYIYRIFPDQTAAFNAFLNGEIDTAGIQSADVETARNTEGIVVEEFADRGFTYYEFNLNADVVTLFLDVEVRQAFMYALDRQSIVDNILLGFGEVAQGTQPTISYAYAPDQIEKQYTYDPDMARQLLEQAGWTDTNGDGTVDKDGQEMAFEFLYAAGSPESDQIVAYMQDAWSQIGVAMTPRTLEFPALIEATTTEGGDWQMALYGFNWDATFIQDAMFGCEQYLVGFNDMKYCNPALDEIHAQARAELDQDARRALLIEAANVVNEEQPVGIMHFDVNTSGYSDRVHNLFPGPWGGPGISIVWVEA